MTARSKVLITGAPGRIGSFLTQYLADRYDFVQFEDFGESLQRGGDEA